MNEGAVMAWWVASWLGVSFVVFPVIWALALRERRRDGGN